MKIIENYNYTCFSCLRHTNVESFQVLELGKGSFFDGFSSEIHLCNDCINEEFKKWMKLEIVKNDKNMCYFFEKDILNFVNNFPIEGREFFYNRFAYGYNVQYCSTEDWISREQRTKYGYCLTDAINKGNDYSHRFMNCEEVYNVNLSENCVVSQCPFGEMGNVDNLRGANQKNFQCECCKHFRNRTSPIKTIPFTNVKEYSDMRLKQLLIKKTSEKKAKDYVTNHINSTQVNESKFIYGPIRNESPFFDATSEVIENKSVVTSIICEEGGLNSEKIN